MRGKIKYAALVLAILVGSLLSWRVRADNPHGPVVVATGGGGSQTTSISTTTLTTPVSDGFFVVLAYEAIHSGSCSLTDSLYWTDTVGTRHTYSIGAGQGPVASVSIYATASNTIQFQVSQSGSCTYDYFILVQKE